MTKESERLNMGLSLLWSFQLLGEWVLQQQSRTKDWHLSWPRSTHNPIAVPWDGSDAESVFPYSALQPPAFEVLTLPLVTWLPLLVSQTLTLTLVNKDIEIQPGF